MTEKEVVYKSCKDCKVCQCLEYTGLFENDSGNSRRGRYWFKLAQRKRERLVKMFLVRTRAHEIFCSMEHFEIAKEWQRQKNAGDVDKQIMVRESIRIACQDVADMKENLRAKFLEFLGNSKNEEVKIAKEMLRRAILRRGQRMRHYQDLIDRIGEKFTSVKIENLKPLVYTTKVDTEKSDGDWQLEDDGRL